MLDLTQKPFLRIHRICFGLLWDLQDIFCHFSAITDGNCLREGDPVEYEKAYDERRGNDRAANVTGGSQEERGGGGGGGVFEVSAVGCSCSCSLKLPCSAPVPISVA